MVERHAKADPRGPGELDAVFKALGDPNRRQMLGRLAEGECSIGELAAPFPMTLAAASKHVKVLERAGLVRRRVEGRRHMCALAPDPLAHAHRWLSFYQRFWADRLDRLAAVLKAAERSDSERSSDS